MSTNNTVKESLKSKRWLVVAVAAMALVLLIGAGAWWFGGSSSQDMNVPVYEVRKAPLTISVRESGTISARDLVRLRSEVRGRNSIIWLIPEGTRVQEGDLLIELDGDRFQEQLAEQQIRVQNTEATFIRASENLEVVRSQAESDVSKAELEYRFAKEDLKKYTEGEYPKQLREFESRITLAQEELEQAMNTLDWSKRLFERQFISESEYERDLLAMRRKELDHELRKAELALLQDYTYHRELAKLESDVDQKRMALERVRRRARADVVQAEADYHAREAELNRQRERLVDIEDQIEKCRIYAPTDGMVVYATTANRRHRGDPLQEGTEVHERQELIHLPRSSSMMAEIQIHESVLDRVHVGMPARILVDALPGEVFTGTVGRIGLLPDQSQWWNPDNTVYSTEIYIDGAVDALRTGMTCKIEVLIDHFDEAIAVPVQAVFRRQGQHSVWVQNREGYSPVAVDIGMDNSRMVHVLSGLSPGDRVHLAPPMRDSDLAATDIPESESQEEESVFDEMEEGLPSSSAAQRRNDQTTADRWSASMIDRSRDVMRRASAGEQVEQAMNKLSEEDQRVVQALSVARESGRLDQMNMNERLLEMANDVLRTVDAGDVPRIRPELRRAVQTAVRQMRQQATPNTEQAQPQDTERTVNAAG